MKYISFLLLRLVNLKQKSTAPSKNILAISYNNLEPPLSLSLRSVSPKQ